jgi:predicted permease
MIRIGGWKRLFRLDRFGRGLDGSMEEELRFHLEERIEQLVGQGLGEEEARAEALRLFGDLDVVRSDCRDVTRRENRRCRRSMRFGDLLRDFRLALRGLRRVPVFTAVAALTLALGIGGVATVFSLINALLIRPLPYDSPDELVCLWSRFPDFEDGGVSYPDLLDWRESNNSFVDLAGVNFDRMILTGRGEPVELRAARVSATTFRLLGSAPILGRIFLDEEDQVGGERAVVLTHRLWQERLGGAPGVVGDTVVLNDESYRVVGIMPPGFTYPPYMNDIDFYLPLGQSAEQWRNQRGNHIVLLVLGRLKPGRTVGQARADMERVAIGLEQEYPQYNTGTRVHVVPLRERLTRGYSGLLFLLLAAVGLVLLIACANVAGMLLSRGTCRRREIAVRAALGAGRGHILSLLLAESLSLWLLGGFIGLLLAMVATSFLSIRFALFLPVVFPVGIDSRVVVVALLLTLFTGIFFGLFPALQLMKTDSNEWLKESGRTSGGIRQKRLQSGFMIAETAVAVLLLFGAGLMIRSFSKIVAADLGMDTGNLLTLKVNLPPARYPQEAQRRAFFFGLLDRIRCLPGVESAATTFILPLGGGAWQNDFCVEGQPPEEPGRSTWAEVSAVSPGYFRTMGIPLVRGRDFTLEDPPEGERQVVVSRSLAARYWPEKNPVGKRLKFGKSSYDNPWMRVVGVVEDVRWRGPLIESELQLYIPHQQDNDFSYFLVVRAAGDPTSLAEPIRREVLAVDPDQPISTVRTMDDYRGESTSRNRLLALLLGAFASLALVLAGVGIYGVVSYATAERAHEIGIRMALGADKGRVLALVLRQGLAKVLLGVLLGLVSAAFLARFLSSSLYGVTTLDPPAIALALLFFLAAALPALLVPARRAISVDPVRTLKRE